jgi:hypothetical protein
VSDKPARAVRGFAQRSGCRCRELACDSLVAFADELMGEWIRGLTLAVVLLPRFPVRLSEKLSFSSLLLFGESIGLSPFAIWRERLACAFRILYTRRDVVR